MCGKLSEAEGTIKSRANPLRQRKRQRRRYWSGFSLVYEQVGDKVFPKRDREKEDVWFQSRALGARTQRGNPRWPRGISFWILTILRRWLKWEREIEVQNWYDPPTRAGPGEARPKYCKRNNSFLCLFLFLFYCLILFIRDSFSTHPLSGFFECDILIFHGIWSISLFFCRFPVVNRWYLN